MNDAELLARYRRDRSDEAFRALVERHAGMVYAVCARGLGRHAALADDATQAVFMVLARKAASIRNPAAVGAWLHAIARAVVANLLRQEVRRERREEAAAARRERDRPLNDRERLWGMALPHLDEAIGSLRMTQREAVVLHYLEGFTQREVAQHLGCTEVAVRDRILYAIGRLRRFFAGKGVVLPAAALAAGLEALAAPAAPAAVVASCAAACAGAGAAGAAVSGPAASAAQGALKALFLAKVKAAAVVVGLTAAAAGGGGVAVRVFVAPDNPPPAAAPAKERAVPVVADRIGWRGDGTGSFPKAQPPVKWSATENVAWKTPMPGRCNGAPIVVGDRVFTCSEPSTLLCVSAVDGKILWSDTVTFFDTVPEDDPEAAAIIAKWKAAKTEKEKEALKKDILRCEYFEMPPVMGEHFGFILEYALPTPTSDGKQVYVVYGTGLVAAYDLEGMRTWVRMLAKPTSPTGYSASPLLAGGRLLINMGGDLHGLDPANGKTAWKIRHKEYYGSPVRARVGDAEVAVMPGGDVLRAADGKKLASQASANYYQSAVVRGDVVYSMRDDAFSLWDGSPRMMAVRLKPAPDGGITPEKLWETKEPSGFSSPVCADGLLYNSVNKSGVCAFEAATGKMVYNTKLNFNNVQNFCSVTRAGPYLYVPDHQGKVWVIQSGNEYKEIGVNTACEQGDQMVGPPLFLGNRMYLRTHKFLFCIGGR